MPQFALVVHLKIKPDCVDKFMPEVLENARLARETEAGCHRFDVLVDPKDPRRVMLYEIYENETAFRAHEQTPHFRRYIETVLGWLDTRERVVYDLLP